MREFLDNSIPLDQEFLHPDHLRNQLEPFLGVFDSRPFTDNTGGLAIAGSFALDQIVRRVAPSRIIESGVWKGHSTWLLEQAAPDAELICFDPRVSNMSGCFTYVSKKAQYRQEDFSSVKFKEMTSGTNVLAFFDDHQDVMERIGTCLARGIKHIVFDDNYHFDEGHRSIFHVLRAGGAECASLRAITQFAFVFPPVYKWERDASEAKPLLQERDQRHERYFADRGSYRWMTYLRLR